MIHDVRGETKNQGSGWNCYFYEAVDYHNKLYYSVTV